jgi:Cof subfamily protein (haloacid dehalogenase superfamily)
LKLPEGLRAGGRFAEWAPGVPAYVVADVDGTLIARGTTATPIVAEAVGEAHAAGLRVGFATGRLPFGVRDLHGQLRPEGPHIVHNGAQVRTEGRPLRTWPIPRAAARRLVELCLANGIYAEFYVGEEFVVTDRREAARTHWDTVTGEPSGLVEELDLDAVELIRGTVVVFSAPELPDVLTAVRRLGLAAEFAGSPLFPGATFVNAISPEADKGKGLVFAAGHLGIGLDEVVAVGDGQNDVSMLAVAGTAVAMGQAPADVIQAAHVVVPEVEADGVAHALRAAAEWRRAAATRRGGRSTRAW